MTVEDNKALVRRALTDLVNTGNMALVDELVAPGFVRHDLGGVPDIVGPHGVKLFVAAFRAASPDIQMTVDEIIAEGDKVVVRYTARPQTSTAKRCASRSQPLSEARSAIGRKSVSQPASPGVPAGRREGAGGNRDAALAACLVAGAGVHQELQLSQCVVGPGGQDFPQYRAAQLRSLSLPCDALQVSLVAIDGIPERKSHGFAPSR